MQIVRVVAAVITDPQGRLLVVRKQGTAMFMQAGGKIEAGEEPLDALARELCEELGVRVAAAEPLGEFSAPAAHEPGARVVAQVYRVDCIGEPRAQAEIAEIAWIDPNAAALPALAPLTELLIARS